MKRMNADAHLLLWDHAAIKVLDVRHIMMGMDEVVRDYKLPASMYLLATRGSAQVRLDGEEYLLECFQVMHSGKGTMLDISLIAEEFEYYMIFYRATIPLPCRQELLRLMESSSPFQLQYHFTPNNPVSLYNKTRWMAEEWRQAGSLERFQVKSLFYQFVYSVLQQLHCQLIEVREPDLATQAIAYIQEHYAEAITLESLADNLNYSVPHLSASFKKNTGYSPIDYLIQIRMDTAAVLLVDTDATLREIAESVGYKDPYYLSRLFKKYKGAPPARFRVRERTRRRPEDCPANIMRSSIVARHLRRYIDNDYYYQYHDGGSIPMFRQSKSSAAAVLLLCFVLLLTACSGASSATSNSESSSGSQTTTNSMSTPLGASQSDTGQASGQMQTKIVSTIHGDVTVPLNPKRIVADQYLGSFVALDVIPIGVPGLHLQNPYFQEALKGVADLGDINGNLEKMLDLQPDLIVTGVKDDQARYEQLSKIAPTIAVPFGELKNAHEELTYFGKLLGKEKEAEAWLADYDHRVAAAKEKVRKVIPADASITILETADKSTYVYGDNFGRGGQAIYQALGFKPPAQVAPKIMEKQWAELSGELLPQYAGDYIILTSNDRTLEDLKADPIWGSLDAVKNNRVYIWKEERSWYFDPIAVLSQTEELAAWLTSLK